jgi:hypothetical protein
VEDARQVALVGEAAAQRDRAMPSLVRSSRSRAQSGVRVMGLLSLGSGSSQNGAARLRTLVKHEPGRRSGRSSAAFVLSKVQLACFGIGGSVLTRFQA